LPPMPRADVPEWLVRELTRAMAKRPSDRHATAREFADALRRATLGVPATITVTTEPKPETPATADGAEPAAQRSAEPTAQRSAEPGVQREPAAQRSGEPAVQRE